MKRLPDSLPASELLKRGAPEGQIVHGLVHLAERALKRRRVKLVELFDEKARDSLMHTMAHWLDSMRDRKSKEHLRATLVIMAEELEERIRNQPLDPQGPRV